MTHPVVFTGSRNWTDWRPALRRLALLVQQHSAELTVIHGGFPHRRNSLAPRGLDAITEACCWALGIRSDPHPVTNDDWARLGKPAGPIRNRKMAAKQPRQVFAFKDDFDHSLETGGTENCVKQCVAAGAEGWLYSRGQWRRIER